MTTYIIIILLAIILSLRFRDSISIGKFNEILMLGILIVISGTRYNLGGSDYELYRIVYENVPDLSTFISYAFGGINQYNYWGWEPGYMLLNSLGKTIGLTFNGFCLLHSLVFYILMYVGLRRYISNFNFLLIVFLYKLFFYETFVAMRQSLTIGMFFYSLKYLELKDWKKYFACSFLAVFFHRGAIILFFIYLINWFKLTKRTILWLNVIFIPTIIVSFVEIPILGSLDFILGYISDETFSMKTQNLLNAELSEGISIFHALEYFGVMWLMYSNLDKVDMSDRKIQLVIKLFLCLLPLFTLLRGYSIFTREKDYFVLMYASIIYYIGMRTTILHRVILFVMTGAICAFGFFRFILLFDNGGMIPYRSWLLMDNVSIFQ